MTNGAAVEQPLPIGLLPAWSNWQAYRLGKPTSLGWEFTCYSDCNLTNEVRAGLEPVQLINPSPAAARFLGSLDPEPNLVIRIDEHLPPPHPPHQMTVLLNSGADEEIASLLSLALGVRLRSGGATRVFGGSKDPRGEPIEWDHFKPQLPRARRAGFQLPRAAKEQDIASIVDLVAVYPLLKEERAEALVRAAGSYQRAVWSAESEPELAWLQLIAAVETAAAEHDTARGSPEDRLRDGIPGLVESLQASCDPSIVGQVSTALASLVRSTSKFIRFVMEFLPPPPAERPAKSTERVDWDRMEEWVRVIYQHRSKALHEAIPMPAAMCIPVPRESDGPPPERLPFLSMSVRGRSWTPENAPMLLHTFEYIAGEALRSWWRSLASGPLPGSSGNTK